MMTSKERSRTLCATLFTTTPDYQKNLETLISLVQNAKEGALVVAHEVCLTGFDYDNYEAMLSFAKVATKRLKEVVGDKILVLTMLERIDGKVFNVAKVIHKGEVCFSRTKARLFRLGGEHKFMEEGSDAEFQVFEVAGIKMALFICFELRFKELWKKAEGADVIVTPSWWGKPREEHFKAFTQTLAIMNQCYVVASDAKNEECTAQSAIITPHGEVHFNGDAPCLELPYEKKQIALMRKYIDLGRE